MDYKDMAALTDDSKRLLDALYKQTGSPNNGYTEQVYRSAREQAAKLLNSAQIKGFDNLNSLEDIQHAAAVRIL
jgi:hypothetical protein